MLSLLVVNAILSPHSVTLKLVDAHGQPIAKREVWLVPTSSTKPVRPIGYQWWIPTDPGAPKAITDAKGIATIDHLKPKPPYMVITRLGEPLRGRA